MEYRNISNLVRKQTRNIHRTEQQEIANSCKENPKKFWNYVNSRRKVRNPIGDLVYKDATGMELKADTDEKRAKALGNFFQVYFVMSQQIILNLCQIFLVRNLWML